MNPITLLDVWLQEEQKSGALNPRQAVLATATDQAVPHARVVAIREISQDGLLFFTQRGTRKVHELQHNPLATIVFWLELQQRQVVIEGSVAVLSDAENVSYWQTYPRESQIRFHSYAPTSTQPLVNKEELANKKKMIEIEYNEKELPMSPFYCGFRLKPSRMIFYAYRADELSDVFEYNHTNSHWVKQLLSP